MHLCTPKSLYSQATSACQHEIYIFLKELINLQHGSLFRQTTFKNGSFFENVVNFFMIFYEQLSFFYFFFH